MRPQIILIVSTVIVLIMSGCARPDAAVTTAPAADIPAVTTYDSEDDISFLLESVELTLPDSIVRQPVSSTREYFYKDGEVVGGIELLDIAKQMDTMDMHAYVEQALAVTKAVYDTDYDYMSDGGGFCRALVSVCSRDGREFYHYFFSGTQMGYDIWMDYDVLDTQDMKSYLKTLHSEDLYNPQDYITVDSEPPLLNLRMTMPEGITLQRKRTTRFLFYYGETLAGGIEQIEVSKDLDTLGATAANLAEELFDVKYDYTVTEDDLDTNMVAKVHTDSENIHLMHFIFNVGTECYDVWIDTAIVSEEDALLIVRSCQY